MTALPMAAGAVDRIRDMHPDLVLLDVMLPEVSGYEICQDVRLDPDLADVKILMMTARGSAIERSKGLALGADGFISKPFELTKEVRANEVRRAVWAEGRTVRRCWPGLSLRLRVFLFFAALALGAQGALIVGLMLAYRRLGSPEVLPAFVQGGIDRRALAFWG